MWLVNSGSEYYSYRFILNNKELVFIELEYKNLHSGKKPKYVGYYFDKDGKPFRIAGDNLTIILFKAILSLKQVGWDIDGFPIDVDS